VHKLPLDAYKSRRNNSKGRCPRNPFDSCATLAISYYNLQVVAPLLCGKSFARHLNHYASIQTGRPVNIKFENYHLLLFEVTDTCIRATERLFLAIL